MNTCVAYIDILGFSRHIKDKKDQYSLLDAQNVVLQTAITDNKFHPISSYLPELQKFAEAHSINSFRNLLCLSDSIFITSNDPNMFMEQFSFFLYQCFYFDGSKYQYRLDEENFNTPTIFSGGISFGDANIFDNMISISNGAISRSKNIVGEAVVDSINLDKNGNHTFIYVDDKFYEKLDSNHKQYIEVDEKGMKYLLWPAFLIPESNTDADTLFRNDPANFLKALINIRKHYKNKLEIRIVTKYDELLELTIKAFKKRGSALFPNYDVDYFLKCIIEKNM